MTDSKISVNTRDLGKQPTLRKFTPSNTYTTVDNVSQCSEFTLSDRSNAVSEGQMPLVQGCAEQV